MFYTHPRRKTRQEGNTSNCMIISGLWDIGWFFYFQVLYFSDFLNFVLQAGMETSFNESTFTMFINTFWRMTKACLGFAHFLKSHFFLSQVLYARNPSNYYTLMKCNHNELYYGKGKGWGGLLSLFWLPEGAGKVWLEERGTVVRCPRHSRLTRCICTPLSLACCFHRIGSYPSTWWLHLPFRGRTHLLLAGRSMLFLQVLTWTGSVMTTEQLYL